MKKSPLTRKLCAFALAVILLLSSLLVSCEKVDYDAIRDGTLVYICTPYISIAEIDARVKEINSHNEDAFLSSMFWVTPNLYFTYADKFNHYANPITSEETVVQINSHPVTLTVSHTHAHPYRRTKYNIAYYDYHGEKKSISFTDDGNLIGASDWSNHESTTDIGIEAAREKAIEFINGRLKHEAQMDIDLSKYELLSAQRDNSIYAFRWGLFINGYCVKKLALSTYLDGKINGFSLFPLPTEVSESNEVLLMSDRDIEKHIFPKLEEEFAGLIDNGYELLFDKVYKYTCSAEDLDTSVYYVESVDKYMLFVQVQFRIVNEEKNIDHPQTAGFLIPLY